MHKLKPFVRGASLGLLFASAPWLRYEIAMARGAAAEGAAFMLLLGTYAF